MKKTLLSFVILIAALTCFNFTVMAEENVTVVLDGETIVFDVPPQIINGRTMVPMRAIFEKLGAVVDWNDTTRTAIAQKGNTTVSIVIDDTTLYKNSEPITLDVPAQLKDSRTLVPLRAVSEAFDCTVLWNDDTQTVNISTDRSLTPSQEKAFDTLKNFIITNSNDAINGDPVYKETYKSGTAIKQYSLDYSEKTDLITLKVIHNGNYTAFSYIGLRADTKKFFSMLLYFNSPNNLNTVDFEGDFSIDPRNFDLNSEIIFSETIGDISNTETYKIIALLNSLEALDFADYIFKTYLSDKNVSLSDFGFTVPTYGYTSIPFGNPINDNVNNYQSGNNTTNNNYQGGSNYSTNAKITFSSFPLYLYADDGTGTFLGEISSNKYDRNSIANEYGNYGSKYQTKSIFNQYGDYGSQYSNYSVFNKYASKPPKILDKN